MIRYRELKEKYPDALMLFRTGTFYETYDKDAEKCSELLELVLCKRMVNDKMVSLSQFPEYELDVFLPKLVRAGYRVALCSELEDPKKSDTEFVPDW